MISFTSSIANGWVEIKFSGKPDSKVRSTLKGNGFRWNPNNETWWRGRVTGAADFLTALERQCSPGKPDGACWNCGTPGFLRNQGAAAPVLCENCWKAQRQREQRAAIAADDFDLANNRSM